MAMAKIEGTDRDHRLAPISQTTHFFRLTGDDRPAFNNAGGGNQVTEVKGDDAIKRFFNAEIPIPKGAIEVIVDAHGKPINSGATTEHHVQLYSDKSTPSSEVLQFLANRFKIITWHSCYGKAVEKYVSTINKNFILFLHTNTDTQSLLECADFFTNEKIKSKSQIEYIINNFYRLAANGFTIILNLSGKTHSFNVDVKNVNDLNQLGTYLQNAFEQFKIFYRDLLQAFNTTEQIFPDYNWETKIFTPQDQQIIHNDLINLALLNGKDELTTLQKILPLLAHTNTKISYSNLYAAMAFARTAPKILEELLKHPTANIDSAMLLNTAIEGEAWCALRVLLKHSTIKSSVDKSYVLKAIKLGKANVLSSLLECVKFDDEIIQAACNSANRDILTQCLKNAIVQQNLTAFQQLSNSNNADQEFLVENCASTVVEHGTTEILQTLINLITRITPGKYNVINSTIDTAMQKAINGGKIEHFKILLKMNTGILRQTIKAAIELGNPAILKLILADNTIEILNFHAAVAVEKYKKEQNSHEKQNKLEIIKLLAKYPPVANYNSQNFKNLDYYSRPDDVKAFLIQTIQKDQILKLDPELAQILRDYDTPASVTASASSSSSSVDSAVLLHHDSSSISAAASANTTPPSTASVSTHHDVDVPHDVSLVGTI